MRLLLSILAILLIVPGYSGIDRLPLIKRDLRVTLTRILPPGGLPRRVGRLQPLGVAILTSRDPAFGSFSGLAVRGGRLALLSDGGNVARFAIRGGRPVEAEGIALRRGPGTGWAKESRDSESLALDPASGDAWVGYERANAIWRYSPDFDRAIRWRAPRAMRKWRANAGAESLARLPDGRFVAISERRPTRTARHLLIFPGDPTAPDARVLRRRYRPPVGYDPSDAAALPNGDLLVLNRRWRLPARFDAKLVLIRRAQLGAGGDDIVGAEIATLAPPLLTENAEGLAVAVERGRIVLWMVTDNDSMPVRSTYLYKFRLLG